MDVVPEDKAGQLLVRAQQLRQQLQAESQPQPLVRARGASAPPELSTRALAELELILAEDPMSGGHREAAEDLGDSLPRRPEQEAQEPTPLASRAVRGVETRLPQLRDFDGVCLKLQTLELTKLGVRKIRGADAIWLRCAFDLGGGPEEILIACPSTGSRLLAFQHTFHRQARSELELRALAARPLQLTLLSGKAEHEDAKRPKEPGKASKNPPLQPLAQAELLWFGALLEPGTVCPFTAELTVDSSAGGEGAVGRLQLSVELTSSREGEVHRLAAECGIHIRLWLGSLSALHGMGTLSELRAVVKLGQMQEVSMQAHYDLPFAPGLVFGSSAVSAASVWQAKMETFDCEGPSPVCIFVQLWSGAELRGLAKLLLEPFQKESVQEMVSLHGYKKVFDGELDVLAVVSNESIGKLQVCAHAGLAPVLLALQDQLCQDVSGGLGGLGSQVDPQEATAALLILACHSPDVCENIPKEKQMQLKQLAAALQIVEPLLTASQAFALVCKVTSTDREHDGSVESSTFLESLRSRMVAVQESFDQMMRDIGEDCGAVALDFLEAGNPARLQRQDVARALKFRGLEVSWACLEGVFITLGCPAATDSLPAERFAGLFRRRAEHSARRRAWLRSLEAEALRRLRGGQGEGGSLEALEERVLRYARADRTLDHLGLAMLLEAHGAFPRKDVDDLVTLLFERLGAKAGGFLPCARVIQWIGGSASPSSLRDLDLNRGQQILPSKPAQLLAQLAAKLPEAAEHAAYAAPATPMPPRPALGAAAAQPWPEASRAADNAAPLGMHVPDPATKALPPARPVQATLQLARPLRGGSERQLSEVLAAALGLDPARLRVLGAEDGASRICVQVRAATSGCESSSQEVVSKLASQLGDPASALAATPLGSYFC